MSARQLPLPGDLADMIRALLRAEIEAVLDQRARLDASPYCSRSNLPVGVSRRAFIETCRSGVVDGAEKDGRGWTCPRSAWHRARGRRPEPSRGLRLVPPIEPSAAELAASTLRRIRGAR